MFISCFLFVAMTGSLAAQERDIIANTVGIGPRVGWYASNDAEEGSWYFGVMGRLRLGKNFGIEATLDYRAAERFSAGSIDQREYDADVAYMPLTLSAMVLMPFGEYFTPYGVAGVGFYYTFIDYDVLTTSIPALADKFKDENSFEPGYHFGLGLEIVLSNNFALHADARYLFLGTEINSINDVVTADVNTNNSDGMVFSLGFMVYL